MKFDGSLESLVQTIERGIAKEFETMLYAHLEAEAKNHAREVARKMASGLTGQMEFYRKVETGQTVVTLNINGLPDTPRKLTKQEIQELWQARPHSMLMTTVAEVTEWLNPDRA